MVLSQQFAWICISESPREYLGFVFVLFGLLVCFGFFCLRKRLLEVRLLN